MFFQPYLGLIPQQAIPSNAQKKFMVGFRRSSAILKAVGAVDNITRYVLAPNCTSPLYPATKANGFFGASNNRNGDGYYQSYQVTVLWPNMSARIRSKEVAATIASWKWDLTLRKHWKELQNGPEE
jgi:hypothetical protein